MALSLQGGMSIDVERFTQGQFVGMETLHVKVKILLVDDDSTILAIASTLLRTFKYEVTAVKNSADALATLRERRDAYDLVVTDYHMPGMNGLELQKVVQAEYKLPVIVMSADERECIIMKTLECGAAFFIMKPIKAEDVKNIWQYAVAARKGKSVMSVDKVGAVIGYCESATGEVEESEIAELGEAMEMEGGGEAVEPEEVNSMAYMAEIKERRAKRGSTKRKHKKKEKDINGGESSENPKRSKVVWTTTLHNLFLQALNQIGLDKAVPKKILEYMGVPGLTRENVASHLQKYRIFLRRVADKTYTRSTSLEKSTKLSFAETHRSTINDFLEDGLEYSKLLQSTLPADFCKNLSSSSPGSLIGSSSHGLSTIQLSSQSLDATDTGIGLNAISSGLQMNSHRVDRMVPLAARLPFGNAVTMTMNSLACTNRTYLQQFQSGEWPMVPLGRVGTIGNTNQGVEKQNVGLEMSGDSFLEKFSPEKTAEDSIDPIDDGDFMNTSGRFMDFSTQVDPSNRPNDSGHSTQVFPSLMKKGLAAITPGAVSGPDDANKEALPTPVEKTAAVPDTQSQQHAGENDFFNLLFEQMHYGHHPLCDSSGGSMDIFSSSYESPFVGAPNQNQEHEDKRVVNPKEPFHWESHAKQDQQVVQQPAGQDIPTASRTKQKDVWTDHPSAEDQIWAKDFVDSLLDSSSLYLL